MISLKRKKLLLFLFAILFVSILIMFTIKNVYADNQPGYTYEFGDNNYVSVDIFDESKAYNYGPENNHGLSNPDYNNYKYGALAVKATAFRHGEGLTYKFKFPSSFNPDTQKAYLRQLSLLTDNCFEVSKDNETFINCNTLSGYTSTNACTFEVTSILKNNDEKILYYKVTKGTSGNVALCCLCAYVVGTDGVYHGGIIDLTSKFTMETQPWEIYSNSYIFEEKGTGYINQNVTGMRFCDQNGYFTYKVLVNKDTKYLGMAFMLDVAGNVSFSKDNQNWTTKNYPTPAWLQEDLSSYLVDNEKNEVYVKFTDATPEDGNGIAIRACNFIRDGKIDLPSDNNLLLKNGNSDKFDVLADPTSNTKNYIFDIGGYSEGGKFRFYDGSPDDNTPIVDKLSGNFGVYKLTYTDTAKALKLILNVNNNYIISVSNNLPKKDNAIDNSSLSMNRYWTDIAVGDTIDHKGNCNLVFDISGLMKDNTDKTIYVRIGDATDYVGGGGWLFSMSLVEQIKIDAPCFKNQDDSEINNYSTYELNQIDLSKYKIVSEDNNLSSYSVYYKTTSDGEYQVVTGNKFTPQNYGEYTIKLIAEDTNGTSGEKEFLITVLENKVVEIDIKSNPSKLIYSIGDELDISAGKITVKYSNGTNEDIDMKMEYISGYDKEKTGEQKITVTYKQKTVSFNITVKKSEIKKSGCNSIITFNTIISLSFLCSIIIISILLNKKKRI